VGALRDVLIDLIANPSTRGILGAAALEQARRTGDAETGYDAIAALLKERMTG
jgi:hypothetical protein